MRVVAHDPQTRVTIIDTADPTLEALGKKVVAYGDPAKRTPKTNRPKNQAAIAPLAAIQLAALDDLAGPRLLALAQSGDETIHWLEVACRGGRRRPVEETAGSRQQIQRHLLALGLAPAREYVATEQVVFYLRCSLSQLRTLLDVVDCIYEAEVVEPDVRDWLIGEEPPVKDIQDLALAPPPDGAPVIVVLDTGIATLHPLLRPALLSADSAIPEDQSPEDTHGHGTEVSGVALHGEGVGGIVDAGTGATSYWLQSVKVLSEPRQGAAAEENRPWWPERTVGAVALAEAHDPTRPRAFVSAVTAELEQEAGRSLWSTAVDQLAFGDERGRLFCISAGNAPVDRPGFLTGYPTLNLTSKLQDPAQSFNALTVGAFTMKTTLPPDQKYAGANVIAPALGISPSTSCGPVAGNEPIKPDIVFEGGNVAVSGGLPDPFVPTLCTLTTGRPHLTKPLSWIAQTSEAVARAGRLAGVILGTTPDLWPETLRGLIVHAADWTQVMHGQFPQLADRLAACGYGVPDEAMAIACAQDRATVLVEDEMPNGIPRDGKGTPGREVKLFRLPIPEDWVELEDTKAELRITLSYFAEPNLARRRVHRGLDLKWDIQGPDETEMAFHRRINKLKRARGDKSSGQPYEWVIGPQRRGRGTVQSDRARISASLLAGPKLIAVSPVLGWWEARRELATTSHMRFSLIVTVSVPDLDVYNPIAAAIELPIQIDV